MSHFLEKYKYRRSLNLESIKVIDDYELILTIHRDSQPENFPWSSLFLEGKCLPDFSDILITTEDGKTMPFEIYFSNSKVAYLNVPFPLKEGDNKLYIYYGTK